MPEPFGPRIATRSCHAISRSIGPSRKLPRVTTAPSSRATTSPLRALGASCMRSSQPSHGFSTRSSRSSSRSEIFDFAATFSLLAVLKWRMNLSVSPLRFTLALPWTDHSFCRWTRVRSVSRLATYSSYCA